jgi:pectate lyase
MAFRAQTLMALAMLAAVSAGAADMEAAARRLEAVRTFADQVLEQGLDRYSGKDTPLFVDGVNTQTGAPVTWLFEGKRYIVSNLASQQNLFRTLDLLSRATGEPRYRDAAKAAIRYHFDHLAGRCGLLRWGGHQFIDLATLEPVGKFDANCHELKHSYPYYELMHEVDPDATARYLRAFWNAHVIDWSRLDMNRHGPYGKPMGKLWEHEFDPPPPFFEGKGLTFINCGTDLIHAAGMLYRLSGEAGALAWAERLAGQYVRARHPETGLGVYQYSKAERSLPPPAVMRETRDTWSTYGDRAENQFGAEFGETAREGYAMWGGRPASIYVNNALVQLALAETLGERGRTLREWTVDGMKAYIRHAYDPETNAFRPMWADGTDLTGFRFPRFGYFGDEGTTLSPTNADAGFLASYARACRLTNDPELWETVRHMARGNGLGELGGEPGAAPGLNLATNADDPELLFAVLEMYRLTQQPAYLELAERIGGNIVAQQVHGGWFLPSPDRLHANFNEIAPLALLHLDAAVRGRIAELPPYVPSRGYIHGRYDGLGRTTDATAIWAVKR